MRISDWSSDVCSSDLAQIVIGQLVADGVRQRADDRPVVAGIARRRGGAATELDAALGIHPGGILLGIGGARQDDVGAPGAGIAMAARLDPDSRTELRGVDLVDRKNVGKGKSVE